MEQAVWKGRMDLSRIYTKTSKGVLDGNLRSYALTREHGRILALIDGKSTIADLLDKNKRLSENRLAGIIDELVQAGFIRLLNAVVVHEEEELGFSSTIIVHEANTQAFFEAEAAAANTRRRSDDKAALEAEKEREKLLKEVTADIAAEAEVLKRDSAPAKPGAAISMSPAQSNVLPMHKQTASAQHSPTQLAEKAHQAKKEAEHQAQRAMEAKIRLEEEAQRSADMAKRLREVEAAKQQAQQQAQSLAIALDQAKADAEMDNRVKRRLEARAREDEEMRKRAEAEAKAKQEEEARKRAEVEEKLEAERKARLEAEARAQAEAEARAKAAEEALRQAELAAQTKLEAERKAREEAEAKAKAETEARVRAEEEARKQAVEAARRQAEAEAEAKLAAERKAREDAEAKAKAEAEARARAEEEKRVAEIERKKAEEDARKKAVEEARRQAEAEAEAKLAAERKAREEAEAKARAEAEARARAEEEKRAAEAARIQAETEARRQAEAEAAAKLEAERQARLEAEEKARVEAEARAKAEAEKARLEAARREAEAARQQAEAASLASQEAERQARAEAEQKAREEAEKYAMEELRRQTQEQLAREAAEHALEDERQAREIAEQAARSLAEERAEMERQAKAREGDRQRARDEANAKARAEMEEAMRLAEAERMLEANEEERLRAEAETRALAAAQAAELPFLKQRKREPFRFDRRMFRAFAGAMLVLLVAGVGLAHVVSMGFYIPTLQQQLSQSLGQTVKVQDLHFSLYPTPHWSADGVNVGDKATIRIENAKLYPSFGSWFSDDKQVGRVELDGVNLNQENLAGLPLWKQQQGKKSPMQFEHLLIKNGKFTHPALDVFDFDANVAVKRGRVSVAQVESTDKRFKILLNPQNDGLHVDLNASKSVFPVEPRLPFESLKVQAIVLDSTMTISALDAQMFDGYVSGSGKLDWANDWVFNAEMSLVQLDLPKAMKQLDVKGMLTGRLDAKTRVAAQANQLQTLFESPQIQATFRVKNGEVLGLDIGRAIQAQTRGGPITGKTHFTDLTGFFQAVKNGYQYRQLKLQGGVISAFGIVDIDHGENLSGHIVGDLQTQTTRQRQAFSLTGKVDAPALKLGGSVQRASATN